MNTMHQRVERPEILVPAKPRGPLPHLVNAIPPGEYLGTVLGLIVGIRGYCVLRAMLMTGTPPQECRPLVIGWGLLESSAPDGRFDALGDGASYTKIMDTAGLSEIATDLLDPRRKPWMRPFVQVHDARPAPVALLIELIPCKGEL